MYDPLKNIEYFKKVAVDQDFITIVWPNGVDFSPDILYEMGKEIKEAKKPLSSIRKKRFSPASRSKKTGKSK